MSVSRSLLKAMMLILGLIFTAVGVVGVFLPFLPTTPFLLVAAGLFLRSSESLHRKLMNHPKFGPAIRRIQEGKGISLRTKILSSLIAGSMILAFAIWGTDSLHLRIFLGVIIVAKLVTMAVLPTYRPDTDESGERPVRSKAFRIQAPRLLTLLVFAAGSAFVLIQVLFALELGRWSISLIGGVTVFPLALLAYSAIRWVLIMANRFLGGIISRGVRIKTRRRLLAAIAEGGAEAVREKGIGNYQEMLSERIESLDPMYSLFLPQLFIGIISPIAVIAVIMTYDRYTALMLAAVLPVTPLILGLLARNFARVGKQYSRSAAELGAWYVESIRALPTLAVFQRINSYRLRLAKTSGTLKDTTIKLLTVNQLSILLVEVFFSLALVAFATFLGVRRFQSGFLPGAFALAVPFLTIELIRPINLVGAFFFAGAAGRQSKKMIEAEINELERLNRPIRIEASGSPDDNRHAPESIEGSPGLIIRELSFAYPSNPHHRVLDGFSLSLKRGEIIGIRGPSGSGKSTLAKMILGYHRPQRGSIVLDGRELSDLPRNERMSLVGYLPQRPYLFGRTLRENLVMGRPDPGDEVLQSALRAAGLNSFAERGLDSPVGENAAQVSGGERMRLALARVLLSGASYIVLDEPTAEIDGITELGIWQELRRTGAGIIAIAHRKRTLSACDSVVDMPAVARISGVRS
ncbi:DUF454 family protein [Salinispira pacifica]|uniref:Transport ATP-binding protein CydD n=1 Tax=Salinispira pacifica TaxID=1307761 RepID=V5WIG5_9SPIO|nr:DUF454 family protein [Salinispira pacifica]AHC15420.1 hypothetical protein L21SP2_2051 [Salinispira pacifica]